MSWDYLTSSSLPKGFKCLFHKAYMLLRPNSNFQGKWILVLNSESSFSCLEYEIQSFFQCPDERQEMRKNVFIYSWAYNVFTVLLMLILYFSILKFCCWNRFALFYYVSRGFLTKIADAASLAKPNLCDQSWASLLQHQKFPYLQVYY